MTPKPIRPEVRAGLQPLIDREKALRDELDTIRRAKNAIALIEWGTTNVSIDLGQGVVSLPEQPEA